VNRVVSMVYMVALTLCQSTVQHKMNFVYVRKVMVVIIHGMGLTLMMTSCQNFSLTIITKL
jgi:uncharacterized protein YhhL (DUF1145 family)